MTESVPARFGQINIVVSDMERSLAFYRVLGVEVGDMPEPWDRHHRVITNAEGIVTFEFDSSMSARNWAGAWGRHRTGVVIGFEVASDEAVDETFEALVATGAPVLQEPHVAFFGARYAVVEDPDGTAVGIMGPVVEERRFMPDVPG